MIGVLENYIPRNNKYVEAKNKLLNNAKKFYEEREKIAEGFKNKVFPFYYHKAYEHRMKLEREEEREKEEEIKIVRDKNGLIGYGKLMRKIGVKERKIDRELVKKYFFAHDLRHVLENFKNSKNNSKINNIQVNMINSGLKDLKEEIRNMSEKEKKVKKPNDIVNIVEDILEVNRQQKGEGLEILTLDQMLSRLPITLAQLKAENNSEKLKNEIR